MSFFIRKNVSKRKKPPVRITNNNIKKKKTQNQADDEISSDSSESDHDDQQPYSSESDGEKYITASEKKVQLAKKFLSEIEDEERRRLEDEDDEQLNKNVLKRLKDDVLDQKGQLKTKLADSLSTSTDIVELRNRNHVKAITCTVISSNDKYAYSCSKDSSIIQWDLETCKVHKSLSYNRKKPQYNPTHHNYPVLSLAVSDNYLASGDNSGLIVVRNPITLDYIGSLTGHKDGVTGLKICNESNQLFSCSKDKSVKVWNLVDMCYVETLFGHQNEVTNMDMLQKDRLVTAGGLENMVRVWKIQDETQLIFNGTGGSIDTVQKIDSAHFVTGSDNGSVSIWGTLKKKPLCNVENAHGINNTNGQPNWVSAVGALENSDLIVSGSNNGIIKFWRCSNNFKSLLPLFNVPIKGFINGLVFTNDGSRLIVVTGNEHRFGRWHNVTGVKNSLYVIKLNFIKK
ncbi:LOW QUALITY PROTEIN: U3 small nucleolar RNA-interacting protein 2 [Rhopalosiphum padi]|uniref:LOW QUALITY PROTEIN: U3 small nucleolar RNA-interacting protein 2 n=1 Tax=Rhopalosiphum padi TaxID=40932 RepID=UPI00298DE024|nr:LOW QUALITY PROTEIN: U3 small nucleolar RNA-interacting protein 2 [Rhopalosiphum padi]